MNKIILTKPLRNGYWKIQEEYLDKLKGYEKELIVEKENKSILLREYEIWLFNTGKIRVVDLNWHTEFLTNRKELEANKK